ncbi:MAG: EamA family transporter [Acidimicrobiaceae bacterium]|nr:DMT family transporter [Acidimicrobiaceae bacterium]MXW62630.1 EamA family transporter [Acidimicrobiaceae bacterium]MXW74760.1 EamA family transporter [Acidimicrobiaceae bacterium]MYC42047.1 EamA family transporter [Acidimicrobiaceae bacterium]MYD07991.1 EamA family transporter [Acidimicrobiaceae bacterium]
MTQRLRVHGRSRGWLYAGCGMLVVSTDSFFVRWSRAEVWDLVFWVALISLVTYFVTGSRFVTGLGRESMNPIRSWRRFPIPLTAIAVLSTVSQISYITAVTRTTVSNVVVIVGASPVMVALVGRVFFSERTSRRVWTAIVLTFAGMTVIVAGSVGEPNLDGDLLAVAAVLAFSIGVNIWRRWPEMSRIVGLSMAAVLSVVVASFFASPLTLDGRAYLACLGMGLLNPLGRLLHTNAPRYAPAAEVALFTPVETVAASLWAWLAFSEVPKVGTVVGAVIIIGGVLYGTVTAREQDR